MGTMGDDDDDGVRADFEEAAWERIRQYLHTHGMVRHQRESFDFFVNTMLSYIIKENSDVWSTHSSGTTRHCIRFDNVHISCARP